MIQHVESKASFGKESQKLLFAMQNYLSPFYSTLFCENENIF